MSPELQHGRPAASPAKTNTSSLRNTNLTQLGVPNFHQPHQHKWRPASYPERVNTGLEVVGDGVCLEKGVVCDGAEGVVFAAELLLQLQGLLKTSLFGWRLSAGIEQRGVSSICSI